MTDTNLNMQPGPKNVAGALALANAATIAAGVIRGLSGKNIADSIQGSPLVVENLTQMACSRMVGQLQKRDQAARDMRLNGYN